MTTTGIGGLMLLLVPAHAGSPGQSPGSRKMVVIVIIPINYKCQCTFYKTVHDDFQWQNSATVY